MNAGSHFYKALIVIMSTQRWRAICGGHSFDLTLSLQKGLIYGLRLASVLAGLEWLARGPSQIMQIDSVIVESGHSGYDRTTHSRGASFINYGFKYTIE